MKNFFLLFFLITSCKIQSSNSTIINDSKGYFEDLSFARISEEDMSKNTLKIIKKEKKKIPTIKNELDTVLNKIQNENKKNNYVEGYTIQLYLGVNRILAEETESKLNELDSLIERLTIFTQPNYRVKIGKYYNRFNANKDFKKFKKTFPNAIIIPEKININ
jgi:hypothetical protein|tara:strand:+ start:3773 stop:4258 length:486 start_codon:yes stop_codon:yes gene_type:complete